MDWLNGQELGKNMIGKLVETASREDADKSIQMSKGCGDASVPYKCLSNCNYS